MDFINFYGHRKTTDAVLEKIKRISRKKEEMLSNLNSLHIFDSITPVKNKIALDEASNSIKMKVSSNGSKCLIANFPNILGHGEVFNVNYTTKGDCSVGFAAPYFSATNLFNNKVEFSKTVKNINGKQIKINKAELSTSVTQTNMSIGVEKINKLMVLYTQNVFNFIGISFKTKGGVTRMDKNIPFVKISAMKDVFFEFDPFFVNFKFGLGRLFGQTNLTEKFFLGSEIKGYKEMSIVPVNQNDKVGGKSFVLLNSRIGFYIKNIELFAFGDVGANTVKGLQQCYEIIRHNDNNNCAGRSVGFGAALKNKKGFSVFYSFPLTNSNEVEKYGFNIDLAF